MSTWDKLSTRICFLQKDLRFGELCKVLEGYGYEMKTPKSRNSHCTFRKSGCRPITIPKHEPIKKVYVEMVKQIVESETLNDKNRNSSAQDFAPAAKSVRMRKGWSGIRPFAVWQTLNGRIP